MCSRNLFCLKGWKREEKHVDWSCAMEIICFVLRGNTWIGHVQWKCFFGKKKSRDTLWLFMCSGNCFFFFERRKSRETCGLVMCNGNVFLARKKAETHFDCSCAVEIAFFLWEEKKAEKRVDWSCAVDICFFAGKKQRNKYINHVQWNLFKRKRVVWSCAVDICFLAENMWIQHVCWMLPHPWLFSNHSVRDGTIGAPIKYGKLDASSQ